MTWTQANGPLVALLEHLADPKREERRALLEMLAHLEGDLRFGQYLQEVETAHGEALLLRYIYGLDEHPPTALGSST